MSSDAYPVYDAIKARHGEVSSLRRAWLTLRSVVFWVWQILATFAMGMPVLLLSPFSFKLSYFFALSWIRLNVYGLRYICGIKWEVHGRENIPDKPCVVLCKHQSTWDTYFMPMLFIPAIYVAKRSLIWIPIFGWSLYVLRFILIDRTSGRNAVKQMVEQARDRIGKGRWLVIFPEGTRRPVGSEPRYRPGGAIVASQLGIQAIPVALNAGEFWPRMGFIKWPGTITVRIGKPIEGQGRTANQIMTEAESWIEANVQEMTWPRER
jgi:1-acyl-sn-glycerol-3-phosphate acyltransferase